MEKINPGSKLRALSSEKKRVPMSVPVQTLEVPDIPGYHQHWFEGSTARLQRALDGGYEFVDERDVDLNAVSLGGDSSVSASTDMGSRVSVTAGQEVGPDGQPIRLVLMKIKQEWWEADQQLIEDRNTGIRDALLGGMVGAENEAAGDAQHRYVDQSRSNVPDFFKPKTTKVV
jgi:hypothetical protein